MNKEIIFFVSLNMVICNISYFLRKIILLKNNYKIDVSNRSGNDFGNLEKVIDIIQDSGKKKLYKFINYSVSICFVLAVACVLISGTIHLLVQPIDNIFIIVVLRIIEILIYIWLVFHLKMIFERRRDQKKDNDCKNVFSEGIKKVNVMMLFFILTYLVILYFSGFFSKG